MPLYRLILMVFLLPAFASEQNEIPSYQNVNDNKQETLIILPSAEPLQAVNQEQALSLYALGEAYWEGRGVEQNYEKAVELYYEAAHQGYALAQNKLAYAYWHGKGIEQNFNTAINWCQKAAIQNYAPALYNLGCCYWEGKGTRQNLRKAVKYFKKAAHHSEAQHALGYAYLVGKGVPRNFEKAVKWYTKAAKQRHARAQNKLAHLYWKGKGVEQNFKKAVRWTKRAAKQGDPEAQNTLGYAYWRGKGIAQSYKKAIKWFKQAARQEYAGAQINLGCAYEESKGIKQNVERAVAWYQKAALQGVALAQYKLGYAYWEGKGVEQNFGRAIEWYYKAALQGEVSAQILLADVYQGIAKYRCIAFQWYVVAAANKKMEASLRKRIIKVLMSQYCSIDNSAPPSTDYSLKKVKGFKKQLSEKLNSLLIETHRLEVWAKGQFGDTVRNKPLQKKIRVIAQTFRDYEKIVTQLDQPFCWINCLQLKKVIAPLRIKVNGKSYSVIEPTTAFSQGNYIKELKALQTTVSKLNSLVIALVKAGTRETMLQVLRFKQLHSVAILKDSLAYLKDTINQPEDEATILLRLQQRQHALQSKLDLLEAMIEPAVSLKSEIIKVIEATVDVRNQLTLEILRAS